MNKLFHINYEVTRKRGLITDETSHKDFIEKLFEELNEVNEEFIQHDTQYFDKEAMFSEVTDLMIVCMSYLIHYGYDPKIMLIQTAEKNKKRIKT